LIIIIFMCNSFIRNDTASFFGFMYFQEKQGSHCISVKMEVWVLLKSAWKLHMVYTEVQQFVH